MDVISSYFFHTLIRVPFFAAKHEAMVKVAS
jgi:hypothetical protein